MESRSVVIKRSKMGVWGGLEGGRGGGVGWGAVLSKLMEVRLTNSAS